ncbi:tetratricopeptide repeat protein [Dyella acidiphila]|uniref:Sel1 repeat family protein n=1 Tax=Dyella acidiphila TaxID=2775866 RepID=A0ABR9GAN7_9GAMM|nr:tetratricopeptide repeat protein [Dyella acidiphila]MBE1161118.1 sel1 repeat family protein [Dyella acidiphila]
MHRSHVVLALMALAVTTSFAFANASSIPDALRQQAAAGNAKAQVALGRALQNDGVEADKAAGTDWFRKAAEQGDADGAWMLGSAYMGGVGVTRDASSAIAWMQKSVQADPVPDRMANMAFAMMVTGMFSSEQGNNAANWAQKAADKGSTKGMELLAMLSLSGQMGATKDPAAAEHWLLLASQKGDTQAQSILGGLYLTGNLGHKDVVQGAHWLQTAADGGNTNAAGELATFYLTGEYGVPVDGARGVVLARKALAANEMTGHYAMGIAYVKGVGIEHDAAKGWYQLALAERMDSKRQLQHVTDYMSTAATQLSTAQLADLKGQVERDAPARSVTAP